MGAALAVTYSRAMTLRRGRWLVAALLALGGDASAASNGDSQPTFAALRSCLRSAVGVRGIDPAMVTKVLANGCREACPGLAEYVEGDPRDEWRPLAQCGLFCSPQARTAFEAAPPAQRWSVLADKCGADYYGLPTGDGGLLSASWFALQRIGAWLQKGKAATDPVMRAARDDLGRALADDRFVLPLPPVLAGRYELPQANHSMSSFMARDYVFVTADNLFYGLVPEATMTVDTGVRPREPFPAIDAVALDALSAKRSSLRTPLAQIAVGGARGVLGPPSSAADKTLAVVRRNATLLIADKELPAARIVQTLDALGSDGAYLAIASSSGEVGAHALALTAKPVAMPNPAVHLVVVDALTDGSFPVAVSLDVYSASVGELVLALNRLYDGGTRLVVLDRGAPSSGATATPKHGSLAKEAIRKVIRTHLDEVKACYDKGLARRIELAGRIMVQFVIAPTGAVRHADFKDSTVGDWRVEDCITSAVKTWQFPAPDGGGVVIVSYPFVLKPAP
jgi:hypothetical protein